MATIDPRYVAALDLQQYLVDKDTGLPLSGGVVSFFRSASPADYKPVYQLVGDTFVPLPDPVILSAVGTFQDNTGNDIIPYYLPFFVDSDGNITATPDLYYVTVFSSGGVEQFTRDNWPPNSQSGGSGGGGSQLTNFIPNPQFLIHNNLLTYKNVLAGGTTEIAQGGWEFVLDDSPVGVNTLTFTPLPWTTKPPQSPTYYCNIRCDSPSPSDTVKKLRIKFNDVNKFTDTVNSEPGSTQYSFGFYAQANTITNVTLYLNKYFGVGGFDFTPVPLTIFTIPTEGKFFSINFSFEDNAGLAVGTGQTYVALELAFNVDSPFNVSVTDFILTSGNVVLTESNYPVETNADMVTRSIPGWLDVPDYDSQDLYLPIILTPSGMAYDHSQIGKIEASVSETLAIGELSCCNNFTSYFNNRVSPDGIPYSRLGNFLWNNASFDNLPFFGTGAEFIVGTQVLTDVVQDSFYVNYNQSGTSTPMVSPSVRFVATTLSPGTNTPPRFYSATDGVSFVIRNNVANDGLGRGNVTDSATPTGFVFNTTTTPFTNTFSTIEIPQPTGATITNGSYFIITFFDNTSIRIYYQIIGSPDLPPTAPYIKVPIRTTDTTPVIALKTALALSGGWISQVQCPAGSTIIENDYLTFTANGVNFAMVYVLDINNVVVPVSIDPLNVIPVIYTTGMSAEDVATASFITINRFSYGLPNLAGMFLRGYDTSGYWDPGIDKRFSNDGYYFGAGPGTFQEDDFANHTHAINNIFGGGIIANNFAATTGAATGGAGSGSITVTNGAAAITLNGSDANKPVNMSVNYIIKY